MNRISIKFRAIRNLIGDFRGVSGCGICGDRWNWKKEHNFYFDINHHNGAFPICEECWQTATDKQIMRASERLADLWVFQSPFIRHKETCRKARLLITVTKKALKERGELKCK